MKTPKKQSLEKTLGIVVAILIIAWSTQNFWQNIRILSNHNQKLWADGSPLGPIWLLFMLFLVVIPFLSGVFLLWKSFSGPRTG
jgi:hypothetical protein